MGSTVDLGGSFVEEDVEERRMGVAGVDIDGRVRMGDDRCGGEIGCL